MTVLELINILESFPPEMDVMGTRTEEGEEDYSAIEVTQERLWFPVYDEKLRTRVAKPQEFVIISTV